MPHVPSQFLEKSSTLLLLLLLLLLSPRHSKTASNCVPKPWSSLLKAYSNNILFCLLQLLFGGSKLQASGLQNGPFATAKQHLMACRNVMQTYPQKLPNVSSKFLRKCFFFCLLQLLFGSSTLQASGRQNGPFATAKQDLIACRNCVQTYPQKLPNVLSEFLEKNVLFLPPAAVIWWL